MAEKMWAWLAVVIVEVGTLGSGLAGQKRVEVGIGGRGGRGVRVYGREWRWRSESGGRWTASAGSVVCGELGVEVFPPAGRIGELPRGGCGCRAPVDVGEEVVGEFGFAANKGLGCSSGMFALKRCVTSIAALVGRVWEIHDSRPMLDARDWEKSASVFIVATP